MDTILDATSNTCIIRLFDEFVFASHAEFLGTLKTLPNANKYVVDLQHVDRIDSSALGMLLLMEERHPGSKIQIQCASEEILKILDLAGLDRMLA